MTKAKALKDQPTDRDQLYSRVFDRVDWKVVPGGFHYAQIGGWELKVRPGVRFWDWTVGWETPHGVTLAYSAGDETGELKAKRAASDALVRAILGAADDLNLVVSLAEMTPKPKTARKRAR